MNTLHQGKYICQILKEEGRTKAWLAKEMKMDPSNLNKILKQPYLAPAHLIQIGKLLKIEFYNEDLHND